MYHCAQFFFPLIIILKGGNCIRLVNPLIDNYSILGTVMSKSYGLAKKATAIAVRVLSAQGSGSFALV